jgi:hypothetical protein
MVKLIQIDRLGPRLDGMLYKCKFDEQWLLFDDVCRYSLDEIIYSSQSHRVQGKWAKQEVPCCMPNTSRNF